MYTVPSKIKFGLMKKFHVSMSAHHQCPSHGHKNGLSHIVKNFCPA